MYVCMYVCISAGDVRRVSFSVLHFTAYEFSAFFERDSFIENLQIRDWIHSSTIRRGNGFKNLSKISQIFR